MTTYETVDSNIEKIWEFQERDICRPKYRCKNCDKAIKESYTKTSEECYNCNNGLVAVGEFIDRVHAMTVYVSDAEKTNFIKGIFDLKDDFEHVDEFARILEMGLEDYPISDSELIVAPPSGTADSDGDNHMIPVGEELSRRVGIPFRDITYKKEDYPSQKQLGLEERLENVRGKIGCTKDSISANTALVIDDIATSCATLSATAQALDKAGVSNIRGLVIARDEDLRNLEFANVIEEVES